MHSSCHFPTPFRENCFTVSIMHIFGTRINKQTDGTPGVLQPPLDSADGKLFQSFYTLCCGNTITLQLQSSKFIYIPPTQEPCVEIVEFQNSSSHIINYQPLISKCQKVCFTSRSHKYFVVVSNPSSPDALLPPQPETLLLGPSWQKEICAYLSTNCNANFSALSCQ